MTQNRENLPGMIGRHPAMQEVYALVRRAALCELPVLIVGETGTGKELVARALHELAGDPRRPFMDVNCAAVPETLAEAEFFGWERGSFTGAHQRRAGLVEAANGGTLFLDEACSLSLALQAKLLRVLELGEFRRVGGPSVTSRFRLVAAISEPLEGLLEAKRWRADFAYRVAGIVIELVPLRDRGTDIRLLAEQFLSKACRNGDPEKTLDASAVRVLSRHRWPGNVRELRMVVQQMAALHDGPTITGADVLRFLGVTHNGEERDRVAAALAVHRGNVAHAARALGMHRSTLHRWLKAHETSAPLQATGPASHATDG